MNEPTHKASLKISQEVIETIAQVAALEVAGVADAVKPENNFKGFFANSVGMKATEVKLTNGVAEIFINLALEYGAKIAETCRAVQKNIKENVQTMTGIMVSKVNVSVSTVKLPKNGASSATEPNVN